MAGLILLSITALIAVVGVKVLTPAQTIPRNIRAQVSYDVYYPTVLSSGYAFKQGSAQIKDGIISYELSHNGSTISVNEQAIPASPPDVASLSSFKQVSTLAGHAAIGNENGKPVAVLLSNTTLVSLIGTNDVPNDVLTYAVTSLKSLPRP